MANFKRVKSNALKNAIKHFKVALARTKPAKWACDLIDGAKKNTDDVNHILVLSSGLEDDIPLGQAALPTDGTFSYG